MQGVQEEGSPSHQEGLERGISKGKAEFSAAPAALETLHLFEDCFSSLDLLNMMAKSSTFPTNIESE